MAYRGENIDIVIKGDEQYNLDNLEFRVLVYPDRHTENAKSILKSEMTKVGSNHYSGTIGYNDSKNMPLGFYTVEVLIFDGVQNRSIFAKSSVFPLYDSASKNIE